MRLRVGLALLELLALPAMLGQHILYEVVPMTLSEAATGLRKAEKMHTHQAPALGSSGPGLGPLGKRPGRRHICPGSPVQWC